MLSPVIIIAALMDPILTTLITAFVIGAGKGATTVGEESIVNAYAALKGIVSKTYSKATDLLDSIAGLEKKPDSQARRDAVSEELSASGALDNPQILTAAEAVVSAAEKSGYSQTIGIDWQDVKAARLKIGQIRVRAGAIGFRAARMEITGEIEIPSIDVGGDPGK